MDEICYYTITDPDQRLLVWQPGISPMMQHCPNDITGDTYGLQYHFSNCRMIYVPWEVVVVMSG